MCFIWSYLTRLIVYSSHRLRLREEVQDAFPSQLTKRYNSIFNYLTCLVNIFSAVFHAVATVHMMIEYV